MVKSVLWKPPTFKLCPFCKKGYSIYSMAIHLSKCEMNNTPNENQRRRRNSLESQEFVGNYDDDDEAETSSNLRSSWPRRHLQKNLKHRDTRHSSSMRPQTAVLKHPTVLDEALKNKVDMAMTKKHFLAAVKLCSESSIRHGLQGHLKNHRASLGFQSSLNANGKSISKSSPSSPVKGATISPSKIPTYKADLPQVQIPNPALRVPQAAGRAKPKRVKSKSKSGTKSSSSSISSPEKVPAPCNSCKRSDQPERFHTHPPVHGPGGHVTKIPLRVTRTLPPHSVSSQEDVAHAGHYQTKSLNVSPRQSPRKVKTSKAKDDALSKKVEESPRKQAKLKLSPELGSKLDRTLTDKISPDDSDNQISTSSNASGGSTGSTVNNQNNKQGQSQVVCSLCGKPFGRVSIKFHEPQCQKKQQALKEKKEREMEMEKLQHSYFIEEPERGGAPYDETFNAIWEAHVQQLVPCDLCNRTFFPDRIEKHRKWCKGATPLRVTSVISLQSVNGTVSNANAQVGYNKEEAPSGGPMGSPPTKSITDLLSKMEIDKKDVLEATSNDHETETD